MLKAAKQFIDDEPTMESMDVDEDGFEIDQLIDEALVSIEDRHHQMNSIMLDLDRVNNIHTFEDLSIESQALFQAHSLESYFHESLSTEGVSSRLAQIWQTYFVDLTRQYDWVSDLIYSNKGRVKKYRSRLAQARQQLDELSGKGTDFTTTFKGLHNYWINDRGYIEEPLKYLKDDHQMSQYVLFEYPKQVEDLIDQYEAILKDVDLSNAANIEASLKSLGELDHPAYVFNTDYMGGRPYMLLTGIRLKAKPSTNDDPIKQVTKRNRVVIDTRLKNMSSVDAGNRLPPDISMGAGDVQKLIEWGDQYLDDAESVFDEQKKMKKAILSLQKSASRMSKRLEEEEADSEVITQMKLLGKYAQNLGDCYYHTRLRGASRAIKVVKGISYMSTKLISD